MRLTPHPTEACTDPRGPSRWTAKLGRRMRNFFSTSGLLPGNNKKLVCCKNKRVEGRSGYVRIYLRNLSIYEEFLENGNYLFVLRILINFGAPRRASL